MPDIDNLRITAEAPVSGAVNKLTDLKDTLGDVGSEAKKTAADIEETGKKIKGTAAEVKSLVSAANNMGFSNVAKAGKAVAQTAKQYESLAKVQEKALEIADRFEEKGEIGIASDIRSTFADMADREAEIRAEEAAVKAAAEAVREKQKAERAAAAEEKMQAQALAATKKQMLAMEKKEADERARLEKAAQKEAAKAAKETEKRLDAAKKAVAGFGAAFASPIAKIKKLVESVKRIAFYRLIRTAIKALTSSIKEGLTNLYDYSKTVGTAFTPAVDNLRQHILKLKNAFATALRPVIEALIPVLIRLADWLSKVADFIAQVLSVLFGKVDDNGRYTRAVLTDLQESTDEAKKLKKELRSLMGFDEINRLDDNSDSGSGGTSQSGGLMFEQAEVSDKAKKWAEWIQKVYDIVKNIVKTIVQFIKDNPWILKLLAVVVAVAAAFKLWNTYLKPVFTVLGNIISKIGLLPILIAAILIAFALFGDKIHDWLAKTKKKVQEFFDKLKGAGSVLADSAATLISNILGDVMDLIGNIALLVFHFVRGDWSACLNDLINIGKNILKLLVHIVGGAINLVLGIFSDLVNLIAKGVTWVHNKVFAPAINWLITAFKNVGIWLHNAWVDLKIGLLIALNWILDKVNDLLAKITEKVNKWIEWSNKTLGTDFKPVDFKIETTKIDDKIEELRKTKLDPIKETVEFVGQWRDPEKLKLQVDTSGLEWAIDNLGRKANRLGETLKSVNSNLRNAPNLGEVDFTHYASGGYPSIGSIFVAGEAGAEWVGNIGGRTGVMNTEQMAAAMYQAMNAALANNPQGGGDIYLDGEVIYKNTVRRNNNRVRATGRSALLT